MQPQLAQLNLSFNNARPAPGGDEGFGIQPDMTESTGARLSKSLNVQALTRMNRRLRWLSTLIRSCPRLRVLDLSYNGLCESWLCSP